MLLLVASAAAAPCSYDYSVWNVPAGRSLRRVHVEIDAAEAPRDADGCSPCAEEQVALQVAGQQLSLCRAVAAPLRGALEAAVAGGFRVERLVGWRPQMSRGPVDANGDRTQLSNHAFGAAVDVNEGQNGLYDACPAWGPGCALRKGGPWRPGADPRSILREGLLVRAMAAAGFAWGGELAGKQKDFMHFSRSGG